MHGRKYILCGLAIALFFPCKSASAETVDTTGLWNGTSFISSYGVPDTATYGQIITPTATQTSLADFTFYLFQQNGTPTQNQAFIYQWDSSTSRIVGQALYQSDAFTAPGGAAYSPVTISASGVRLAAGTQYVLFFTTSTLPGQPNGTYRYGSVVNTAYAGGQFVFQNNGTNFANLSSTSWSTIAQDLALILNFVDLSHDGELGMAAVSAGLQSADMFLGQISDPFVTEAGFPLPGRGGTEPLGYYPATATQSAAIAVNALAGNAETPVKASPWTMWGGAYGETQNIDGSATENTADTRTRVWGVTTGFTRMLEEGRIGFALGGGGSNFSLDNNLGSGHAGVFNIGAYASQSFGNTYISASGGYAFNNVSTSRQIFRENLTADFNAHALFGRLEGGYRQEAEWATITPYAALQATSVFTPSYTEAGSAGSGFSISYGSDRETALRTELGARFERAIPTEQGNLKLTGRFAWAWNADVTRSVVASYQNVANSSFAVDGAQAGRNTFLVDIGADFAATSKMSINVTVNAALSGNDSAFGASAKLKYRW